MTEQKITDIAQAKTNFYLFGSVAKIGGSQR